MKRITLISLTFMIFGLMVIAGELSVTNPEIQYLATTQTPPPEKEKGEVKEIGKEKKTSNESARPERNAKPEIVRPQGRARPAGAGRPGGAKRVPVRRGR